MCRFLPSEDYDMLDYMETQVSQQVQPVTAPGKSKRRRVIPFVALAILVVGALVALYFNAPGEIITDTSEPTEELKVTIATLESGEKQLANDKYHYAIDLPSNVNFRSIWANLDDVARGHIGKDAKSKETPSYDNDIAQINYEENGRNVGSITITQVGIFDQPLESLTKRVSVRGTVKKITLNGSEALEIGDTPYQGKEYYDEYILIRNSHNLTFLIKLSAWEQSNSKEPLQEAMRTFRFTKEEPLPQTDFTLSGRTTITTGSCLNGSKENCITRAAVAPVVIYKYTGEANASIVATLLSDRSGYYSIKLPPGTYSIHGGDNKCDAGNQPLAQPSCGRRITIYNSDEVVNIRLLASIY